MNKRMLAVATLCVAMLILNQGCLKGPCPENRDSNWCREHGYSGGGVRGLIELEGYAHDLELMASLMERQEISTLSDSIVAKFGLSETRSFELAKFATQWQKLSHTRQMSAGDRAAFEVKVLGTTVSTLEKAYKKSIEGEPAELNRLIENAAKVNGISPEHVNGILAELFFN